MKEVFAEYTYLASTPEEFEKFIEQAMDKDTPEAQQSRISYAQKFSWKAVADNLLDCIKVIKSEK